MKSYCITLALVTSLALLGTSTGCAVSSSAPETNAAPDMKTETTLVNDDSHATLKGAEMRIERRAGESAVSLVEGSDWHVVAPGVWEIPSADGTTQRVAAGEDGHRWLVEQADAELEGLYAQRDAGEVKPELDQKIATAETMRKSAEQSMNSAVAGPSPQAVSCNISLYTGPSSPVTSPPIAGAAALGQIVCGGGCMTFTVTSQACCNGYCSGLSAFSRTVCGTPWTAGTIVSGYGLGYASVNMNPPNITQSSSSFYCQ
jgi:hypothetical protein